MAKLKTNKFQIIRYILIAVIFVLIGVIFYTTMWPQYRTMVAENAREQVVLDWLDEVRVDVPSVSESDNNATEPVVTTPETTDDETSDIDVGTGIRYDDLYNDVKAYNERLFAQGQTGLRDVFDYEIPSFDLSDYGVSDDIFGAISIPKINVILPLYLGATYRHMADGFAQMSHTSIPIGGESTNAVIACHRGWNRMAYLRDVEMLEIGDLVYVHNLWEDLEYKVVDIYVVEPSDLSVLEIQEGRDLITLFTCHPYGVSDHRYIVVCERYIPTESSENSSESDVTSGLMTGDDVKQNISQNDSSYITQVIQSVTITTRDTSGGTVESSSQVLFWTVYFPWLLLVFILILAGVYITYRIVRYVIKRAKKKKKSSFPIRML